ncbi:hypothetical protein WQ57_17585 [Mesobacillus campisalis]|uniref:Lipoprotein n=1 Tax=Mesobacillus campisalis TaxID=1408103 RepID=A0A0M2SRI8_9BACI|nr:hypothetical protein [Mesobacillus campisalis]KKK36773.1 hypothetical protein WQ57_17585 [Mesobacillus campisalis]
MKNLLLSFIAITLAIVLSACGGENKEAEQDTAAKEGASEETNIKKPLVQYYMGMVKTINEHDAELNAYEQAEEPASDMKAAASSSAAAVAEEVQKLEIPEELKEQKADIENAVGDIISSYEMKAEELEKDAPALDEANEVFAQGVAKLGTIFENAGLQKPGLAKEVN